jgi:hypothetical protein
METSTCPVRRLRQDIEAVEKQYLKLIGGSLKRYLDGVYKQYRNSNEPAEVRAKIISASLSPLEALADVSAKLQNESLRVDGLGLVWNLSLKVCKRLQGATRAVEDVLCYALLGVDDLVTAHDRGVLIYQNGS